MAFSAPGSGGYQGKDSWYRTVALEVQKFFTNITTTILNIGSILTTTYTIKEATDGYDSNQEINIQPSITDTRCRLGLAPSGVTKDTAINLFEQSDQSNTGVMQIGVVSGVGFVSTDKIGGGTVLDFFISAGAKEWDFNHTTGSLTLPGFLKNTAIADLAAAAGQFWLSSTNVDNLKYSSATTLYTLHSTKSATNNATSAAPAATASATSVMMAVGGAITPANTGRVLITISGQMANDTINDGATVDLRYGTGAAPANGDAVTGTLVGIAQTETSLVGGSRSGFCISGIVTGLTLGTAIWIDASLKKVTGGNASITGVTVSSVEV